MRFRTQKDKLLTKEPYSPNGRFTGRLPKTHATTTDVKKYLREWRRITTPLCKVLGAELIGFDPDILVRIGHKSHDISIVLAERILSAVEDANDVGYVKGYEDGETDGPSRWLKGIKGSKMPKKMPPEKLPKPLTGRESSILAMLAQDSENFVDHCFQSLEGRALQIAEVIVGRNKKPSKDIKAAANYFLGWAKTLPKRK
jgi:hypothetical protein